METDDFRAKRPHDEPMVGQRLVIKRKEETLADLQSMETFPVPSVGDQLRLSSRGLLLNEHGEVAFEEEASTDPPAGSGLYRVEEVAYEYATVEPSDEVSDQYTSGFSLRTSLLVSKTTSSNDSESAPGQRHDDQTDN